MDFFNIREYWRVCNDVEDRINSESNSESAENDLTLDEEFCGHFDHLFFFF